MKVPLVRICVVSSGTSMLYPFAVQALHNSQTTRDILDIWPVGFIVLMFVAGSIAFVMLTIMSIVSIKFVAGDYWAFMIYVVAPLFAAAILMVIVYFAFELNDIGTLSFGQLFAFFGVPE